MEKGFLKYMLVLIWVGAIVIIPKIFFSAEGMGICGIIAASTGMAVFALSGQAKEHTFRKDAPYTNAHIWVFLAYSVAGMFIIAFSNINPGSIKPLAQSVIIYAIFPIISFSLECASKGRKEERKEEKRESLLKSQALLKYKVGDKFSKRGDKASGSIVFHVVEEYEITFVSQERIIYKDGAGKFYIKSYKDFEEATRFDTFYR